MYPISEINKVKLDNAIKDTVIIGEYDPLTLSHRIKVHSVNGDKIMPCVPLFQTRWGNNGLWLSFSASTRTHFIHLVFVSAWIRCPSKLYFTHQSGKTSFVDTSEKLGSAEVSHEFVQMVADDPVERVRVHDERTDTFIDYTFNPAKMTDKITMPGEVMSLLFSHIASKVMMLKKWYGEN